MDTIDVAALTRFLQEAEEHHGRYEVAGPAHHWSDWYSAYLVARMRGRTADEAEAEAIAHVEAGRTPAAPPGRT